MRNTAQAYCAARLARIKRATACATLVAVPVVAHGQNVPVIFQHGINSDQSTWQPLSEALATVFQLTPIRITTGSRREYEVQAQILKDATPGLGGTTIGVGHSNGGIVLRQANKMGRPLRGLVTVGTPHSGAGIAQSFYDGRFAEWVGYLTLATSAPVLVYQQYYDQSNWWTAASYAANGWFNFGVSLAGAGEVFGLTYQPLLSEMAEGSEFREGANGINGAANLQREATEIPYRVGIVSSLVDYNGVVFRSYASQSQTNLAADGRAAAEDVLDGAGFYYAFYGDESDPYYYEKRNHAQLWFDASRALRQMDVHWCYNIRAYIGGVGPYTQCALSDGLIPSSSQYYPSSSLTLTISGVSHGEETGSDVTKQQLDGLFRAGVLTIPLVGGAPPGTLTLALNGPSSVISGDWSNWDMAVSGGTPPYRYQWSGFGTGTDSSFGTTQL
jgi:pimeloyl-ACP methyl ester carboxylesterase